MKEVVVLTKLAEDAIKKNELKLAKIALVKAIKLNPTSAPSYMLLGNTYYLLGDKLNSIKCYLAAIHIQISTFTKMQTATFSTMLNIKFDNAPEEIRELLPCKEGMIIYEDSSIPSHIAHSFFDIDPVDKLDPIVKECSKIYKKHLLTRKSIKEITSTSNICYEDYLNFDESHYIVLGREFLIDHLAWDNIDSKEVLKLYFSNKNKLSL